MRPFGDDVFHLGSTEPDQCRLFLDIDVTIEYLIKVVQVESDLLEMIRIRLVAVKYCEHTAVPFGDFLFEQTKVHVGILLGQLRDTIILIIDRLVEARDEIHYHASSPRV